MLTMERVVRKILASVNKHKCKTSQETIDWLFMFKYQLEIKILKINNHNISMTENH
jgi:hypothetical protein